MRGGARGAPGTRDSCRNDERYVVRIVMPHALPPPRRGLRRHARAPRSDRRRDAGDAEGNLGMARSFYFNFKGPDGKLNLKAHNLQIFMLLAAGVDDESWEFHAKNHDGGRADRAAAEAESRCGQGGDRQALHATADRPSGVVDDEMDEMPSTRHAASYQ